MEGNGLGPAIENLKHHPGSSQSIWKQIQTWGKSIVSAPGRYLSNFRPCHPPFWPKCSYKSLFLCAARRAGDLEGIALLSSAWFGHGHVIAMRYEGRYAWRLWGKNFSFFRVTLVKKHTARSNGEAWDSCSHVTAMVSARLRVKPGHWPSGKTESRPLKLSLSFWIIKI